MTREDAKQQAREEWAESLGVPIGDLAWLNRLWGRGFDAGRQWACREMAAHRPNNDDNGAKT